ncbi:enoyl-CoA hydratase/isomerase family protein [Fodinibius sediminis]|uniref:Enoyl-CoA hydratase n=1 Tax=Fodinibius sediminis TaxID=1214077 RepID=A0A521DZU8_9BACT|nr:enoyl-CoA hydratase-related protein [Fodinibius sediminis]SMO77259.1 enoyl-CoA hydratase [Fodinibius sediminis]
MSLSFDTLILDRDDNGIATITINRPAKLNALNAEVLEELEEAVKAIRKDQQIMAAILTGTGDKAFVAGADIRELRDLDGSAGQATSRKGQQVMQLVEDSRKPVVAAVNGYALGGGAELAMACHLRVAGDNAVFGLPEVGLGLIPGYGGTQRLPLIVGRARALEMILSAKQLKAAEALEMGLVNRIAEDNPVEAARSLLMTILENGPLAIRHAIEAVYQSGTGEGYQVEADLFGKLCETEDFAEGTSAFLEKRPADFKGK